MNLESLQKLALRGEGSHLEFKKKANFPEKIVKELVAFANTMGGRLLLGVDDNGTVSGTRDIEGEVFVLEKAINQLIEPQLTYTVEVLKINEKKGVAVFSISEGLKKPYSVREQSNTAQRTTFVRCGDESLKASKEMRQILRRRNSERDERFVYGDKEQVLMRMLDERKEVTLEEFSKEAKIPKFIASKTLVKLVLANLLDIAPSPIGDRFFAKSEV